MAILFHQNMLNFGGAAPARNAAFTATFTAGFPVGPVDVAGFTEIVNNVATQAALTTLCGNLGITFIGNFSCGQTALANGPEYVGIGVRTAGVGAAAVCAIGRFGFNKQKQGLSLIHQVQAYPVPAGWGTDSISGSLADFRGAVYVIINLGGTLRAIGFLHNRYKDPHDPDSPGGSPDNAHRELIFGKIPEMLSNMHAAMVALNQTLPAPLPIGDVYLGGDFNIAPVTWRTPTRNMYTPHGQGLAARPANFQRPPPPPPIYPVNFTPGGTTAAANLYDYWYAFNPMIAPTAFVVPGTLGWDPVGGGRMSDHCGTIAQV